MEVCRDEPPTGRGVGVNMLAFKRNSIAPPSLPSIFPHLWPVCLPGPVLRTPRLRAIRCGGLVVLGFGDPTRKTPRAPGGMAARYAWSHKKKGGGACFGQLALALEKIYWLSWARKSSEGFWVCFASSLVCVGSALVCHPWPLTPQFWKNAGHAFMHLAFAGWRPWLVMSPLWLFPPSFAHECTAQTPPGAHPPAPT